MPPPLVGSRANLEHQNAMSDAEGLERIEDEDDLADRIAKKLLVPVPTSIALTVNGNLPVNHRYCRPWTALFLSDLARSHAAEFHSPLEVSSAVRTVAYQKRLMGINGNAAAAEGDIVSPHLTGATIDIAKGPLSRQEIAWMRTRLLTLEQAGKIDVEEEFQQACFHITVYKNYAPPSRRTPPARTTPARPAHRKSVQPEIALADTAQPDATPPRLRACRSCTSPPHPSQNRSADNRPLFRHRLARTLEACFLLQFRSRHKIIGSFAPSTVQSRANAFPSQGPRQAGTCPLLSLSGKCNCASKGAVNLSGSCATTQKRLSERQNHERS
jgi:hypothetical protein